MLADVASRVPRRWRGWVLPLGLLLLWWASSTSGLVSSPLMVSPQAVWQQAGMQVSSGQLWLALKASIGRDLLGLLLGASAGLLVGSLMGLSRLADQLLGPSFHTLKQISLFAWIPLLSVWFGLGDAAKVAFLALAAFFPVVLNTHEGIRSVPLELIEVARVLRLNRWQWWTRVILPAAAPSIFAGLQLALIYAWLATLGAEYLLASGPGLGQLLIDGREHFQMDLVIFGVIVVGLVGFAMTTVASTLERRALAWRLDQQRQTGAAPESPR